MESPLTKNDLELIAEQINKKRERYPLIFIESCFSILSVYVDAPKSSFGSHCYAGISNCNINCDLTFQPCTHLKRSERFESIDNYWHSSIILKSLRNHPAYTLKPCHYCGHNNICSMCRAMYTETCTDYDMGSSACINFIGMNDRCTV
jgi:MoaA/NifB/PqqE/SkfB family radical SAM enzyme